MIAKHGCCKLAQMLAPGTRLGPYEIIAPAGAGGMGEVYRARDTRLDRTVAVKVLASSLTARPDVLQRFEREARAVSTLNHPNICTLHDVGTDHGTPYLVMEYVEGETLADRLERGPLPLADAWADRDPDGRRARPGTSPGHHTPRPQARECDAGRRRRGARTSSCWISDSPNFRKPRRRVRPVRSPRCRRWRRA